MTYAYFYFLKKYQGTVPCVLEQVTLKDLESFILKSGKEEKEYDVLSSSHCGHGSDSNW